MHISHLNSQAANREWVRPASSHANASAGVSKNADATSPATELPALANAAEKGGQKAAPPGLEQVLARLMSSTAMVDGNAGQQRALEQITRNLARYKENQALVQPPAAVDNSSPPPETPAPV